MTMLPNVSIIAPTYCRPQLAQHLVNQFLAQSLGNLTAELLLVHDGPWQTWQPVVPPHSAAYRVEILETETHEGNHGADAKDEGMFVARGDYVAFWNDDNEYHPHAIATLYALASACEGIGAAQVHFPNLGGKTLPPWPVGGRVVRFRVCEIDQMNCMVRRDRIPAGLSFASSFTGDCQDFQFWDRVQQSGVPAIYAPVVIGRHL